jgi:hypothetical protein
VSDISLTKEIQNVTKELLQRANDLGLPESVRVKLRFINSGLTLQSALVETELLRQDYDLCKMDLYENKKSFTTESSSDTLKQ